MLTSRPVSHRRGVRSGIPDPCSNAWAMARIQARREISVKIPGRCRRQDAVRLAAQGESGPGRPAGDLVEVRRQAHDVFVLKAVTILHCTVSVPIVDAALGVTVRWTPSWTA